jgi:hypothetical protein
MPLFGCGERAQRLAGCRLGLCACGDVDRPAFPVGFVDQSQCGIPANLPVVAGTPVIVDGQNERSAAAEKPAGVEHRMRKRQDHQRRQKEAQGQQPPGCPVGSLFALGQSEQEANRREHDA